MSARRRRTVVLLACVVALAAAAWFAVTAGDAARPGHPPPGVTWVRFVDEDGAPVSRVEYDWNRLSAQVTEDDVLAVESDEQPRSFDVRRVRGLLFRWTGAARAVGHVRVRVPTMRFQSGEGTEMQVVLGPPREIAGAVVGPGGEGVPGVAVSACVADEATFRRRFVDSAWPWTCVTDGTGRFRMDGFGPGEYAVRVSAGDEWVDLDELTVCGGSEGLRVHLVAATTLTLTVLDPAGHAVDGAHVEAGHPRNAGGLRSPLRRSYDGGTTDAGGSVVLGRLPPAGAVALAVDPPRDRADLLPTDVVLDGRGDAGVRLPLGVEIAGVLRAPDGAPIPGAWVETDPRPPDDRLPKGVPTDSGGRFRVGPFPADASVRLIPRVCSVEIGGADARASSEEVAVTCDLGAYLVATCADATGDVVLRVVSGTMSRESKVGPSIPVFVPRLDPEATYTLVAGPTRDGRWGVARDVRADGRTVALSLAPGIPVAGRVVPARACAVEASRDGLALDSVRCGADGRFRFPGLPEGKVRLEAFRDGGQPRLAASADVAAGAEDVVLDVEASEASAR